MALASMPLEGQHVTQFETLNDQPFCSEFPNVLPLDHRLAARSLKACTLVGKKLQRGMSLLEMSLVMIVIAVMAGAGFLLYSDIMHNISSNNNTEKITQIAASLKKNFGAQNLYSSITTSIAVTNNIIPQDLVTNSASPWTAGNSYGGSITIVPNSSGLTTANDSATLTWPSVPNEECTDVVNGTSAVARKIVVGSTTVKATDSSLSQTSLATACDAASTSTIVYYVGRQ
jgi:prepilin-type N-terminal cleavage/methylation domain-containing protein